MFDKRREETGAVMDKERSRSLDRQRQGSQRRRDTSDGRRKTSSYERDRSSRYQYNRESERDEHRSRSPHRRYNRESERDEHRSRSPHRRYNRESERDEHRSRSPHRRYNRESERDEHRSRSCYRRYNRESERDEHRSRSPHRQYVTSSPQLFRGSFGTREGTLTNSTTEAVYIDPIMREFIKSITTHQPPRTSGMHFGTPASPAQAGSSNDASGNRGNFAVPGMSAGTYFGTPASPAHAATSNDASGNRGNFAVPGMSGTYFGTPASPAQAAKRLNTNNIPIAIVTIDESTGSKRTKVIQDENSPTRNILQPGQQFVPTNEPQILPPGVPEFLQWYNNMQTLSQAGTTVGTGNCGNSVTPGTSVFPFCSTQFPCKFNDCSGSQRKYDILNLRAHYKTDHANDCCGFCYEPFSSKNNLDEHESKHYRIVDLIDQVTREKVGERYQCLNKPNCGELFHTLGGVKKHFKQSRDHWYI